MTKKRQLSQELKRIVAALKANYRPEKIVLYGSLAGGKVNRWSDLDLMIVKKTSKRFYDRIGEVLQLTKPRQPLDVLVYTPEEYQQMKQDSWFVGEEIAKKGKTIYAI